MQSSEQPEAISGTPQLKEWPSITVIVAVFNAEGTLVACIESLLAQDYPCDKKEILFVDNGSTDGSLEVLKRHAPDIKIIAEAKRGSAAARNTGIRAAANDLIAFTDSDCVASSDWLSELAEAHIKNPTAHFIGGQISAYRPTTAAELYGEIIWNHEDGLTRFHPPYAITANLLMSKTYLVELGLFDESFLRGQDAELSYRGFKRGAEFLYVSTAVVYHHNVKTVKELFLKGVQHGTASAHFYTKNPERASITRLRRCLGGRFYWRILRDFATSVRLYMRSKISFDHELEKKSSFAFFNAVFNLGKQSGFVRFTLRDRLAINGRG